MSTSEGAEIQNKTSRSVAIYRQLEICLRIPPGVPYFVCSGENTGFQLCVYLHTYVQRFYKMCFTGKGIEVVTLRILTYLYSIKLIKYM